MITRRSFTGLLLLALFVVSVPLANADKTLILKTVTINQVDRLNVEVVNGTPTAVATYRVVNGGGVTIGNQRALAVALTAPQVSTLVTFLNSVIVPAINTAEGL